MAGNKYDTEFAKHKVNKVKIKNKGLYGSPTTWEGNIYQAITHLTNLL